MRSEPAGERRGGPIREQLHRSALLQIDKDRAVALALTHRPVIDAQYAGCRQLRRGSRADKAQQGRTAGSDADALPEACTGQTTDCQANGHECCPLSVRAPAAYHRECRQAFGEDVLRAPRSAATKAAHTHLEDDRQASDREVRDRA